MRGHKHPNILFVMTDQQRFDTIGALGNEQIHTPNLDRLVARGVSFTRAYSTCPVCVAARYTIRTGCEPASTRVFSNAVSDPAPGQEDTIPGRCGAYLAEALAAMGYRTWGIGKFHTQPDGEDIGYQEYLQIRETYATGEIRHDDAYASWILEHRPEYAHLELLHGERTEMYYMPQCAAVPADCTAEAFAADRAVERIRQSDPSHPWFGMVSFVGPHPPLAPPIPFNRMYDPDRMPAPICGDPQIDHADDFLAMMNYMTYAETVDPVRARCCRARYYGEISHIDDCLGRILDAVDNQDDPANTVICFFSDHGDHLGDHASWQKESFFDAACHVPMLVSWPHRIPAGDRNDQLVCLTDLFALATAAAGSIDRREGIDLLAVAEQRRPGRQHVVGVYGQPGTRRFKVMVRDERWKYIFLANGGRELLFDLDEDADEVVPRMGDRPEVLAPMRRIAAEALKAPGTADALAASQLRTFAFEPFPRRRLRQFDRSRGVTDFPENPADIVPGPDRPAD